MKKIALVCLLFCFGIGNAQTKIVELVFEKEKDMPYAYYYLEDSDKLILTYEKETSDLVMGPTMINKAECFSNDGKKTLLFENEKLTTFINFSPSGKTIDVADYATSLKKPKTKFFIDGKFIMYDYDYDSYKSRDYFGDRNISDKFIFSLLNQKDKREVNFLEDDIRLKVEDIFSGKSEIFNLEKPSIKRLVGPEFIEIEEELGFKIVLRETEGFDLITKSISNDYKRTIMYVTNYSNDGKIKGETEFKVELQNNVFLYSYNNASFMKYYSSGQSMKSKFHDDLFINDYYVDKKNGDVYIYGLFGDESSKLNKLGTPLGYYVFKFDKSGNKIWESVNRINNKHFNSKNSLKAISVNLEAINDVLCISVDVNENKEYINYAILDKVSGTITKSSSIIYDDRVMRTTLSGEFKEEEGFKNKDFRPRAMIALDYNPKILEHIKSKKSKKTIYYQCEFTDKGILLFERTDKEYKVYLF